MFDYSLIPDSIEPAYVCSGCQAAFKGLPPRFVITSFKVYGKCGLCTVRILNVLLNTQ